MTLRLKLIVTGDLEKVALHESLRQFFPSKCGGDDVEWETPRKLAGEVTTHRLERRSV